MPNGKIILYYVQHNALKLIYPEYEPLSSHQALINSGHIPNVEKVPTVNKASTLDNTHLLDFIRNPIAYGTKEALGSYSEWIPGTGTIIPLATITFSLYNIYNTPEIKYDAPTLQALGSGARAMKIQRKTLKNRALKRLNRAVQNFTPKALKQKFCGRR